MMNMEIKNKWSIVGLKSITLFFIMLGLTNLFCYLIYRHWGTLDETLPIPIIIMFFYIFLSWFGEASC